MRSSPTLVSRRWSSQCIGSIVQAASSSQLVKTPRGFLAVNAHLPTAWATDNGYDSALCQLSMLFDRAQHLGRPAPWKFIGGDWNAPIGDFVLVRSASAEHFAVSRMLAVCVAAEWILATAWMASCCGDDGGGWETASLAVQARARSCSDRRPVSLLHASGRIGTLVSSK